MSSVFSPEIQEVIKAVHYQPAISIILPFEPKMSAKAGLVQQLKFAVDKVEREVGENYNDELAAIVLQKLRVIIKTLNFNTHKKSIAIYVSPVFEKVLYLDIPVEEKIIIDESFEIRDLVYAKKEVYKYLVLIVSGKSSKVYLGDTSSFIKIKSNVPDHIAAFENDTPEKVANYSDPSHRKEVILKKFLHQTDRGLKFLLQAYRLPVFVAGTEKVLGYFKAITKNERNILDYIPGNYEEASETELLDIINPYVNDWKKVKMEDLRHQMEKAADAGKLAIGMEDVWRQASQHKGRLLIVEKNFMFAAQHGSNEETIYKTDEPYNKFSYIKDAVDDVIETVLQDGGDVEFVDKEFLSDYHHIALVQYY